MNQTKNAFLVGLCSLIGLAGLIGLLAVFGEMDRLLIRSYPITINTDNSAGLRPGSSIVLNGVPVGRVDEIHLQQDLQYPVRVVGLLEQSHRIPASATFRIEQALIGGSATVALIGAGDATTFLAIDGSASLSGHHRSMVEQVSDALSQQLAPLTDAMTAFDEISQTFSQLGGRIEGLLEPQAPGDAETDGNLHTAIIRINTLLDESTTTISLAQRWLGDEALQTSARDTVQQIGAAAGDAQQAVQRYEALADTLQQRADQLLELLAPIVDQLGVTLAEAQQTARLANEGPGTVSQLLNNPDLYNSLNDAAIRLERTLVQLQLLTEKIKTEGLPIDF